MNKFQAAPGAGDTEFRLRLVLEKGPGRAAIEGFIRDRYARAFGAQITSFMPWLVEMRDRSNSVVGAIGLRSAAVGPLFLERYLNAPAEQAISAVSGGTSERSGLVELGNLAADSPGALRQLIVSLIHCLHGAGLEWALFTLLPSTHNAFTRLGLPLIPLAEARAACLVPEERAAWGNYYERHPKVLAGCLAEGHWILETHARQNAPISYRAPACAPSAWV